MVKKILTVLLVYLPTGFVLISIALVVFMKWGPVEITPLMLKRTVQRIGDEDIPIKKEWVPIEDISINMIKATIAAEDQHFFLHDGFDFDEMRKMCQHHLMDDGSIRGCSTISQQTAKNCFTFCSPTWLRKGIEAYYTVLIEKIWGKRRILEVYLNVAELGPGIYGVEAASNEYYHIHAHNLTMADASSLACCLPNPLHRNPEWVNMNLAGKRSQVAKNSAPINVERYLLPISRGAALQP